MNLQQQLAAEEKKLSSNPSYRRYVRGLMQTAGIATETLTESAREPRRQAAEKEAKPEARLSRQKKQQ